MPLPSAVVVPRLTGPAPESRNTSTLLLPSAVPLKTSRLSEVTKSAGPVSSVMAVTALTGPVVSTVIVRPAETAPLWPVAVSVAWAVSI